MLVYLYCLKCENWKDHDVISQVDTNNDAPITIACLGCGRVHAASAMKREHIRMKAREQTARI